MRSRLKSAIRWILSSNGVLFTLILGIFVNFFSSYLQDLTQRQRYLELLQLEVTNHAIDSETLMNRYDEFGELNLVRPYHTDVYLVGLQNGYILSLPPATISSLNAYYTILIPSYNVMIEEVNNRNQIYADAYQACLIESIVRPAVDCTEEESLKKNALSIYSETADSVAAEVNKSSNEILDTFRPAQDRMRSPLLRLLMGSQSLEALK